jgi:hypothetical protein
LLKTAGFVRWHGMKFAEEFCEQLRVLAEIKPPAASMITMMPIRTAVLLETCVEAVVFLSLSLLLDDRADLINNLK